MGGRLHLSPLDVSKPLHVLDVGCGGGTWARAFASSCPQTQVTAIDIDPPAATATTPSNCRFSKADANSHWDDFAKDQRFDYIHVRMMMFAIRDWPAFFSHCFKHLRAGGWLEVLSASHPFCPGDRNAVPADSAFVRSSELLVEAWNRGGIDSQANVRHGERLRASGFADVSEEKLMWPIGEWAHSDEGEKQLGRLMGQNYRKIVGGSGAKALMRIPGMKETEAQEIVEAGIQDAQANTEKGRYHVDL